MHRPPTKLGRSNIRVTNPYAELGPETINVYSERIGTRLMRRLKRRRHSRGVFIIQGREIRAKTIGQLVDKINALGGGWEARVT